ncbi:hypothetical protein SLE2022_374310 [Rubroshorea leprosula]
MGGLGFRSLHEFNVSMLGKQGWRLMTNPDSLAAWVLKAKYFPRTDLMHAELKPACSLTWRSIWGSQELLRKGCRKLIGDGRSTEIWGDPWLPGYSEYCIQSPRLDNCELRYVSDLIDDNSHTWNRDLILSTFNPHEARLILSLPLGWMQRNDGWMWSFTWHGNYSVCSGYHCVMNMQRDMDVPRSSSVAFGDNKIWDLNILGKIKFFTWSAYCNVLPTKENLQKKHVQVDLQCPVCGFDIESIVHCLLFCSVARAVWHGSPLNLHVFEFPFSSFADFFDIMSTNLEREQLELLCTLSWKIWNG